MNDKEKYAIELMKKEFNNRISNLEKLLLSTDKSEVISTILKTTDDINGDNINSGTVAETRIHTDIARENELVDTTSGGGAPTGKNGDMHYNDVAHALEFKIDGDWYTVDEV